MDIVLLSLALKTCVEAEKAQKLKNMYLVKNFSVEKGIWHSCPVMSALSQASSGNFQEIPASNHALASFSSSHEFFVQQCFSSCGALPSCSFECCSAQ